MDPIADLFDLLDAWRHLPGYQLERRADPFFALYLPEVLERKLGWSVSRRLIPEFPVLRRLADASDRTCRSCKIDYLALSADGERAVFVELKTDEASRRIEQDRYLLAAQQAGLRTLLADLLEIACASHAKTKYLCLLQELALAGLLRLPGPTGVHRSGRGLGPLFREAAVTCRVADHHVIYVQPHGEGDGAISFPEFAETVERYADPVSQRFARSLRAWARGSAGQPDGGGLTLS